MKIVTSITIFDDAVGKRMSITYSEVDETTGTLISDNKRIDRLVFDPTELAIINQVKSYAQTMVNAIE